MYVMLSMGVMGEGVECVLKKCMQIVDTDNRSRSLFYSASLLGALGVLHRGTMGCRLFSLRGWSKLLLRPIPVRSVIPGASSRRHRRPRSPANALAYKLVKK